nr:DNA-directed RNA polymerase subunit [Cedratvirus borely]
MFIPLSILYEIFQNSTLENRLALCCREFYSILSSEPFWKERLSRLGLPLLNKGSNLAQWKSIYRYSLCTRNSLPRDKNSMIVALHKIPDLEYITCPEVDKKQIFGFVSLARKYRSYRHCSELFLCVSQECGSYSYKIFSSEKKNFFTSKFAKKTLFYVLLSEQSYNLLLYKLTYLRGV